MCSKRCQATLTHTEACRMVEETIERVAKTLAYIRLRLYDNQSPKDILPSTGPCSENRIKSLVDKANVLCNINYYGAYLSGATAMYVAMERMLYLDYKKKVDWIEAKAQLKLFMENTRNLEWLLTEIPEGVDLYTQYERDKKGKVIGAKCKFYKKEIIRKEI